MDNLLRDGLCSVGMLYLILHLWRSLGSIRKGIASTAPGASTQSQSLPALGDRPIISLETTTQAERGSGRFDRF